MDRTSPWPALALARGVLAVIVAIGHLGLFLTEPPALVRLCGDLSFGAVVAFLIISGYSIGASLERSAQGFYRRRLKRLGPWYAVALIAGVLAQPDTVWQVLAASTLFLQGWIAPALAGNTPLWSLGVEAACYLVAPLLHKRPRFALALAAISLVCYLFAPILGHANYPREAFGGVAWLCLSWAFVAGLLLRQRPRAAITLAGIGAAVTTLQAGMGGAILLAAVALLCLKPFPAPRWAVRIGDLSYPLYLLHVPLYALMPG